MRGTVQGVGFRPAVWRLAHDLQLAGEVFNDGCGVLIRTTGFPDTVSVFLHRLQCETPSLSDIETIEQNLGPSIIDLNGSIFFGCRCCVNETGKGRGMARVNRREVLSESEIQVVHCINRCVRRAYLCGTDPLTGADYEHRRELIRQRMKFLAGVMAVDVIGYCVMSNHFHVILRNRPDVVQDWSDNEVAQRWWQLCPARREADGTAKEPTEFELNAIRNDGEGLVEKRKRLSSVSWFMRFLCEKVARVANRQDRCTGRFWEGRFKTQLLPDEAALLACMQYVDLNPLRAQMAKTPEQSDFTSAQDRSADVKSADDVSSADARDNRIEHGQRAGWLSPVPLESRRQKVRQKAAKRRCSNRGCISLSTLEYLQLLDWTGRQIVSGRRGRVPPDVNAMLEHLQISRELWVDCVQRFPRWFRSMIGRSRVPDRLQKPRRSSRLPTGHSGERVRA